jgi:hypothetical protein
MLGNLFTSAGQLLAGQLSGVDQMIGGALVLALCAVGWLIGWNRRQRAAKKPGMASLLFIASSFAVALLAIGSATYGLGLRASTGERATETKPASSKESLIKDARIDWEKDGTIWLTGIYNKTGTGLTAYVAGFQPETFNLTVGIARNVMLANSPSSGPRIEAGIVSKFGRDTEARVRIGTLSEVGNNWILQLGERQLTVSRGGYFGTISLSDDKDENAGRYPFAIVSRKVDQNNPMPIVIGPDAILFQLGMLSDAGK